MRTTLTLDDDVAEVLRREARTKGMSFKTLVNAALRRGLAPEQASRGRPRVKTRPHGYGFKPGMDLDKLNQLVDELEAEAFRGSHRQNA